MSGEQGIELELRKFVAPEFIFGVGARFMAGRYAKNFGTRKVLVVSDPWRSSGAGKRWIWSVLDLGMPGMGERGVWRRWRRSARPFR